MLHHHAEWQRAPLAAIRLAGEAVPQPRPGQDVLIVGNGPGAAHVDRAAQHDAWVVRFNNCPHFDADRDDRIDELVLVNCGGQMEEWLRQGRLGNPEAFARAALVTFPVHPGIAAFYRPVLSLDELRDAARQDFTWPALARVRERASPCLLYTPDLYRRAATALGEPVFRAGMAVPSSGFLACYRTALAHPRSRILIAGFGFAGWDGHPWARERAWCEALAGEGRLVFLD